MQRAERPDRPQRPDRAQCGDRPQRPEPRRIRPRKPGVAGLGVDLATLDWQRSGTGNGALEVAFVPDPHATAGSADGLTSKNSVQWILLRVAGDPAGRVLVYDRTEWLSFVDGAGNGEFDWALLPGS